MPEVVANILVDNSITSVWNFVKEMDNWAPMMKGYVSHEKQSEADSVWTLTGDLGPFSKTVDLRVHVTEWLDAERVAFEMEGVTEQHDCRRCENADNPDDKRRQRGRRRRGDAAQPQP